MLNIIRSTYSIRLHNSRNKQVGLDMLRPEVSDFQAFPRLVFICPQQIRAQIHFSTEYSVPCTPTIQIFSSHIMRTF